MRIAFLACPETMPSSGTSERRGDAYEHDLMIAALRPAIEARGGTLTAMDWRTDAAELAKFDLVLLGTAWDYQDHAAAFLTQLEAIEAAGTRVCNPPDLVRWNMDKRYLRDLAAKGAATIPTLWIDDPDKEALASALAHFACDRIVVKRQIGAGALGQHLFTADTLPPDDWRMGQPAMIQALPPRNPTRRRIVVHLYRRNVEPRPAQTPSRRRLPHPVALWRARGGLCAVIKQNRRRTDHCRDDAGRYAALHPYRHGPRRRR